METETETVGRTYGLFYTDSDYDSDESMSGPACPDSTPTPATPKDVNYPTLPTAGHSSPSSNIDRKHAGPPPPATFIYEGPIRLPPHNARIMNTPDGTLFPGRASGVKREREASPEKEEDGQKKVLQTADFHGELAFLSGTQLLTENMLSVLRSGKYSDYAIRCGGFEWRVHLNILTARAPGLLPEDFTPTGTYTICCFAPAIIESILEFTYSGDYSDPLPPQSEGSPVPPPTGNFHARYGSQLPDKPSKTPTLHHHIILYGAAHKFDIPGLQPLVLHKMKAHFERTGYDEAEYDAAMNKCLATYVMTKGLGNGMMFFFQDVSIEHIQPKQRAREMREKQMYGEALWPKIRALEMELAGKITGMLLEMENELLVELLNDDELLRFKVQEAKKVYLDFLESKGEAMEE